MTLIPVSCLRRLRAWLRCGLIAALALGCAATAAPAAAGKLFLWEVKSGAHTVYVFGSMHAARQDFYPLPAIVEDAYRQADELVVEVDITDQQKVAATLPLLTYAPPDSLEQHLSAGVWKQLQSAAQASGSDVAVFKPLKPAIVASGLLVGALLKHGYDPKAGIDLHFLAAAHADGKPIVELETVQFQAGVLGGLSDEEGDAMLGETLEEMRSGELLTMADQLAAAWKAGDDEALGRLLREENRDPASKRIFVKLFDDRNPAMAEKIAALAAGPGRALVVIGAGHLSGDNNVLQLLQARGLQVRQLP
jgi:hypothetical protein